MVDKVVFFSRCRPQGADIVDLALKECRIFIGYPAWIKDATRSRTRLRKCIVDLGCSDEEWATRKRKFSEVHHQHYQQNRNLVRSVTPGTIALIPRANRGIVYASRIKSSFELLDSDDR